MLARDGCPSIAIGPVQEEEEPALRVVNPVETGAAVMIAVFRRRSAVGRTNRHFPGLGLRMKNVACVATTCLVVRPTQDALSERLGAV